MKHLEDDVWMAKEDIPNARQAFKDWLNEDNTWENVLDGADKYAVAEMAVNHFIKCLLEQIQRHVNEHDR